MCCKIFVASGGAWHIVLGGGWKGGLEAGRGLIWESRTRSGSGPGGGQDQ